MKMSILSVLLVSVFSTSDVLSLGWLGTAKQSVTGAISSASTTINNSVINSTAAAKASLSAVAIAASEKAQSVAGAIGSASTAITDSVINSTVAAKASLSAAAIFATAKAQSLSNGFINGALHMSSMAVGARIAQLYKLDRNKILFATAYSAVLRAGIQYYKGTSYLGILGDTCIHTAEIGFGFASRYFYDMMVGEKKPQPVASSTSNQGAHQQQSNQQIHLTLSAGK